MYKLCFILAMVLQFSRAPSPVCAQAAVTQGTELRPEYYITVCTLINSSRALL